MIVSIKPAKFTKIFKDFVKNSKLMVNFKIVDNVMKIQLLDEYTVNCDVDVDILSSDSYNEISVWIDKTINILTNDEDIILTISDAVMNIRQGTYSNTLLREYESRREYPDMSGAELNNAYSKRLKYIVHSLMSCMGMSKELGIEDPDPVFTGGKVYADYQQAVFIEHMEYPEFCVTLSMLRGFVFKLDDNALYKYLKDNDVLYFISGDYEYWIPVVNHNIDASTIAAVEKKLNDIVYVTTVSIKDFADRLSLLASVFPKQKLSITFGENTFSVNANSNNTFVTVGNLSDKYLINTNVTSAQLDSIIKLFKEEDEIKISRGGNCICLQQKEKTFIVAGMIY